ncbi:MAG: SIR2 family protein [Chthoniobacteraceae bacterium]
MKNIARLRYAIDRFGSEAAIANVAVSDWKPFLTNQSWFLAPPIALAENFPLAVEHLLKPQHIRRKFLMDAIRPKGPISQGYHDLADIIARKLCWTVLTTNFDALLSEALVPLLPHIRDAVEINRAEGDLEAFSVHNRCQTIYLHGCVELYRDKNLINETQEIDKKLAQKVWRLLTESPLIVIGYRGAEASITDFLLRGGVEHCDGFRHGIYWCNRDSELHPHVSALKEKLGPNFTVLPITGFDELLHDLRIELTDEAVFAGEHHPDEATSQTWDSAPALSATFDNIDMDLALATFAKYTKRFELPVIDRNSAENFMLELRLAVKKDGKLIPTNGCLLLFGKEPEKHFPHAVVALVTKKKKQLIVRGNIIQQFDTALAALRDREVNPILRIKNENGSEDREAYPARAITEAVANLLIHRDYESANYAQIDHEPGNGLIFSNPGGLMPKLHAKLNPAENGRFLPMRGESALRNPVLADIFCGMGSVDKAGSGLPDVQDLMLLHGGKAEFSCVNANSSVQTQLLQAEQKTPDASVASRRTETDVFVTNLLPFQVIPPKLYTLALLTLKGPLLFESDEERESMPLWLCHDALAMTFADPRRVPQFANRNASLQTLREYTFEEVMADEVMRRNFVWLIGRHWSYFLRPFQDEGLFDEFKRKRAYFRLGPNGEPCTISYISRLGRRSQREAVKQRGTDQKPWFENEGFYYQVVQMSGEWAMQIKPTYVFTQKDGQEPLPPSFQTSRATRRFKFDRNKAVDDDLSFWAAYLSQKASTINLGRGWDDDLIIDTNYVSVEVPAITLKT